jgi:hypothetical protein
METNLTIFTFQEEKSLISEECREASRVEKESQFFV